MHKSTWSRRSDTTPTAAPPAEASAFGRMAMLAATVALLALALVRPAASANQSGPTVNEISWAMSGLCRALGGIDEVNPTRNVGGLLNVYFKCKGGYLDGLDCKIGDAGDPTKGSCSFRSAPAPRQWAAISGLTDGTLHDLASVNDLVQGPSPARWADVSRFVNAAAHDLVPAAGRNATASDADRGSHRYGKSAGKGKADRGKGRHRNRD